MKCWIHLKHLLLKIKYLALKVWHLKSYPFQFSLRMYAEVISGYNI